jgi:hypothetical protein
MLRKEFEAQQQQIQQLRDEAQRRDAAMQQLQQQLSALQSTAQQAQSAAQTATSASEQNQAALTKLQSAVGTVETSTKATATAVQAAEKKVTGLESPLSIKYKGVTITPGGFISANVNWRKNNQNLDNFGSFGAIPFDGSSASHLSELRLTGRYTRISLFAEGKTKTFAAQGYYEMDFEGAAQTANENQTNSFQPRIRELWANVDAPHGVSFAGGQMWSLITSNRIGVGPRNMLLPAHINASLTVGWHYTRQNGFRVYKKWDVTDKKKVYLAFAVENPETTAVGSIPTGFTVWGTQGRPVVSLGAAANCAPDTVTTGLAPCSTIAATTSVDAAPDLVAKVAIEPGWGHFELGAIGRFFRDRVAPSTATGTSDAGVNHTSKSGGISFNGVLPVVPKKVDVVFTTLGGRGIGRYGTIGVQDVTYRPDATLQPILGYQATVGVETHPYPKLDIDIYGGNEYYQRSPYYTGGTALLPTGVGYGLVSADLRGCTQEIPAAGVACAASNRDVWQISPGFWYRFYRGPAGTIQYGMFYSYYRRYLWTGRLDATGATRGAPQAEQHEILTAFRWYFP